MFVGFSVKKGVVKFMLVDVWIVYWCLLLKKNEYIGYSNEDIFYG